MLELFIAAWGMGIIGSLHCVGMCGPLALALPIDPRSMQQKIGGALLYNMGRVTTYAGWGLLFGSIGQTFSLFGFQQWLSIIVGLGIIIYILFSKIIGRNITYPKYIENFFLKVRSMLSSLYQKHHFGNLYLIGLLNGLLPCGLVYIALAGALATGNITNSIIFMVAFGLGTLPAMWSITFIGNYINIKLKKGIKNIYPLIMLVMAGLLIVRGLGLGVHYISPKMNVKNTETENCHTNKKPVNCIGK